MENPGENTFSGERTWRKYRNLGGNVSFSPQNKALVFCGWNAAYPCSADLSDHIFATLLKAYLNAIAYSNKVFYNEV